MLRLEAAVADVMLTKRAFDQVGQFILTAPRDSRRMGLFYGVSEGDLDRLAASSAPAP